jgi:hypothetical protein
MADEEVLLALRDLAASLGKSELTVDEVRAHLPFSGETLRRRWRTSRAAFEAAGLSATELGRRYTDQECFENLLKVWTHYVVRLMQCGTRQPVQRLAEVERLTSEPVNLSVRLRRCRKVAARGGKMW